MCASIGRIYYQFYHLKMPSLAAGTLKFTSGLFLVAQYSSHTAREALRLERMPFLERRRFSLRAFPFMCTRSFLPIELVLLFSAFYLSIFSFGLPLCPLHIFSTLFYSFCRVISTDDVLMFLLQISENALS